MTYIEFKNRDKILLVPLTKISIVPDIEYKCNLYKAEQIIAAGLGLDLAPGTANEIKGFIDFYFDNTHEKYSLFVMEEKFKEGAWKDIDKNVRLDFSLYFVDRVKDWIKNIYDSSKFYDNIEKLLDDLLNIDWIGEYERIKENVK